MILKVCGMRNAENMQQLDDIKDVDWMGFIFTSKSKRYALAGQDFQALTGKKKVGVFIDASVSEVLAKITEFNLDLIQLHGFESVEYITDLKRKIRNNFNRQIFINKVFRVDFAFDFEETKPFDSIADFFLFDTKGKDAGGNGIEFDWSILENYHGRTPFLLAGGIGPNSIDKLKLFSHKQWVGIDVNSGFESEPGIKNINAIRNFTDKLNGFNSPAHVVRKFVKRFNQGDVEGLAELYHDNAINHQVANDPIVGKGFIENMFKDEFGRAEMTCLVENIFEMDDWGILEWKDPKGLRGCGFFHVVNGKINFQRGYWDKLSFLKMHNIPINQETINN